MLKFSNCFIKMVHPGLYINYSPGKGRGIFTSTDIPADTMLETAPVVVMTAAERVLLDQTILHNYIFEWMPDGQDMCCMALGYIAVYNHSYTANCEYFMDYENWVISIKTVRAVEPGEELTINYNGDWDNRDKVWFDAR